MLGGLVGVTLLAFGLSLASVSQRNQRASRACSVIADFGGKIFRQSSRPNWLAKLIGGENDVMLVDLSHCGLTDAKCQLVVSHLDAFPSLTTLLLGGNPITDAGLLEILKLDRLVQLDVSETQTSDRGLSYLAKHKRLRELRLDHNQVTDAGMHELGILTTLRELSVSNTGVTDDGLAHLAAVRPMLIVTDD